MQKCVFAKKLVYVDNCECPIEFVLSVCDRERERERERDRLLLFNSVLKTFTVPFHERERELIVG